MLRMSVKLRVRIRMGTRVRTGTINTQKDPIIKMFRRNFG